MPVATVAVSDGQEDCTMQDWERKERGGELHCKTEVVAVVEARRAGDLYCKKRHQVKKGR